MTPHPMPSPMPTSKIERRHLVTCLAAADRDQVLHAAAQLAEGLAITPLQPAESGLALMQWRDAVMHQPFFLGEVPMARAAIALTDHRGQRAEGGAVVMADDADLAHALALLDAIHSHDWPGAGVVEALALSGAAARERVRTQRQAGLQRTRVDFSLLAEADDDQEADA